MNIIFENDVTTVTIFCKFAFFKHKTNNLKKKMYIINHFLTKF